MLDLCSLLGHHIGGKVRLRRNCMSGDMAGTLTQMIGWQGEAMVRLLAATLLGGLVGLERAHHGRSAGFRTQLLVALGSAIAMVVSLHFARVFGQSPHQAMNVDPARVAYGVMGGIGFLGAGTIIRYGTGVRGLTTAASLWCVAAIGLACGFGMYLVAAGATLLVIFALIVLSKLDHLIPSQYYKTLTFLLPQGQENPIGKLRGILHKYQARVVDAEFSRDYRQKTEEVRVYVCLPNKLALDKLTDIGQDIPDLLAIGFH
jgi:putative Mg2+ transporter-C (MgtC) family protein